MPGGADVPRWYIWLIVAALLVVALSLLVLWVDLRHRAALERGEPLPSVRIVVTPSPTPMPAPTGGVR